MTVIIDGTTGIVGATWTTANRPSSPVVGQRGFNTTLNGAEIYNGEQWNPMSNGFSASGGTITRIGGYTIHTFLSSGTFTPDFAGEVEYLVVGGGGGGGLDAYGSGRGAGGGGAGGFKTSTNFAVAATGLTVTIGAGGAGTNNASAVVGLTGANSVFSSITASGGGGGGGHTASGQVKSGDGASSGGGSNGLNLASGVGSAIAGQGYQGGVGRVPSPYQGGGGGGASAVGADAATTVGGAGGAGTYSNFSGSILPYAGGGGGGGGSASVGGVGGVGGGGAGGITSATAGTANTGGGGGGCRSSSSGGGSGIVIIRYPTAGQLSIITSATAGKVVQIVNTQTGAVATGTTTVPLDDSIPQKTEGNEFMTLAITPTSATNKLKIEVVAILQHSADAVVGVLLFQDSTANALASDLVWSLGTGTRNISVSFTHYMAAGTTSATTFKVRAGGDNAGTMTFNGRGTGRIYGGTLASSITITEYTA